MSLQTTAKNVCLYCGIRCSNKDAHRYRLTKEEILDCCSEGYGHSFRTFALQGGEDLYFTDERSYINPKKPLEIWLFRLLQTAIINSKGRDDNAIEKRNNY